jgi:predicted Co/Zn/Cd cation transporter (cation efflux family)
MRETLKKLKIAYWTLVIILVLGLLLIETDVVPVGVLAGIDEGTTEFVFQTIATLVTLAMVYMSLRLFRFKAIVSRLKTDYGKWSMIRIAMLGLSGVLSLAGYGLFLNVSFEYLLFLVFIALVFITPTEKRYLSETLAEE